ncbi:MAG TPA: hypothetical protein DCQ83_01125 [Fibrobacteres bacterium]|nr:hypothetical protein [Fibrobacterota bacterium]
MAASLTHAITVRYKEVYFGTDIREAYGSLYLMPEDTTMLRQQWDSLLADSPCSQRSTVRTMDCPIGKDYWNMTQQQCCVARTKGKKGVDVATRLMEARAQNADLKVAIESGHITEHVEIRECTYRGDLFFDVSKRFWKYEVTGNRYPRARMPMVFAETDSLLRFMSAKYGRPSWKAKRGKLTFNPNDETYYANWEFKDFIMYLVINGSQGMFAAKEVVMDRKLAKEYENWVLNQGKTPQTLTATPK